MAASQQHVTAKTPSGANLIANGATFRTWAPGASAVYIAMGDPGGSEPTQWTKNDNDLLGKNADGVWSGFCPVVKDGDEYRCYVVGTGGEGFKRDPYARELQMDGFPECNCIVRDPNSYKWHDQEFQPPEFSDLIVY